jgi:hypothetical protein
MNSPDCNNSLFNYNPNDYIDLQRALTEEERSHSSSPSARINNYRYSLKSMDDNELDQFRRSLVTPMSVNYKSQDPMYNNMRYGGTARQKSPLERRNISPTNSFTTETAESVALFNHLSNGWLTCFILT